MAYRYRRFSSRSSTGSYFRDCKWCGQRIHMRQMPHGQWVAFDGDESVHECGQSSQYDNAPSTHAAPTRPVYPSSPAGSPTSPQPSAHSGNQPQSPTTPSISPQPAKSESLPAWIWWAIAIVILYFMFKK